MRGVISRVRGGHTPFSLVVYQPGTLAKWGATVKAAARLAPFGLRSLHCVSSFVPEPALQNEVHAHFNGTPLPFDVHYYNEPSGALPYLGASGVAGIFTPYEPMVGHAVSFAHSLSELGILQGGGRHHAPEGARFLRDKQAFREIVNTNARNLHPGLMEIWHSNVPVKKLSVGSLRRMGAPDMIVVKPLNGSGSRGVGCVDLTDINTAERKLAEIGELLPTLKSNLPAARPLVTDTVQVEAFVKGEEFSVECLMTGGTVYTLAVHWKPDIHRQWLETGDFLEGRLVTVPRGHAQFQRLEGVNGAILRSLPGLGDGVFNAEYRVSEEGMVLPLEIGGQPGGGLIAESAYIASGVDLYEVGLRLAAGLPSHTQPIAAHLSGEGTVYAPHDGMLQRIVVELPDRPPLEVMPGREQAVVGSLNAYLAEVSREMVFQALRKLPDEGPFASGLRRDVVAHFLPRDGAGIRAEIAAFQTWYAPGTEIRAHAGAYIAGLNARSTAHEDNLFGLAEITAAMGIALGAIRCIVQPVG